MAVPSIILIDDERRPKAGRQRAVHLQMPPTSERVWERRLHFLQGLFRCTLLFVPTDRRAAARVRWIGAFVMISIVAYHTLWTFYRTFVDGTEFVVTSLVIFCWYLQAFFSMCFCVYWQMGGHLEHISAAFTAYREQSGGESPNTRSRTVRAVFGALVLVIVVALTIDLLLYYFSDLRVVNVNVKILEAFGGGGTGPIGVAVSGYSVFCGMFVMHAYVLTTLMAHREFLEFNEQLKAIGSEDESRVGVAEQLGRFYERQIGLTNIVRQLNNTFEVYAFVMLGSAIPTTIFTIVTLIQRLKRGAFFSAGFMSLGFTLCAVELIALTFTPAKIHTASASFDCIDCGLQATREVEAILFANRRIWLPFHAAAHQTGALLVAHVNQSTLGISVWGFALLSKPLILSVVSLTVTYLVLLVQVGREEGVE